MVREQVADFSIEYVQALDEEGNLDESEAPDLDEETLRELYRLMKLSRRVDERAVALQRRGELGTYAPGMGQEAAQVGSALALAEGGWMVSSFREGAAYLARGTPVHRLLWYALGMEEGAEVSGGNFPPSIPVGSQPLHAAGVGWGQEMTGADEATSKRRSNASPATTCRFRCSPARTPTGPTPSESGGESSARCRRERPKGRRAIRFGLAQYCSASRSSRCCRSSGYSSTFTKPYSPPP